MKKRKGLSFGNLRESNSKRTVTVVVSGGDNITETGVCRTGMRLSGLTLNRVSHFSRPPFHEDHSQKHEVHTDRVALFTFSRTI